MWASSRIVLVLLSIGYVRGHPNPIVECASLDKFSVDYFFAAKRFEPAPSACLFYTKVLSKAAMQFARRSEGQYSTIWDLFPCELYNASPKDKLNPLRCLMADEKQKRIYFANMSKAMALSCDVSATLMTEDIQNIPLDGIWGVTELPALVGKGKGDRRVDWIEAVNPNGEYAMTIWERPERFGSSGTISDQVIRLTANPTQNKSQQPLSRVKRNTKRDANVAMCPYVSTALMERWWDDVEW